MLEEKFAQFPTAIIETHGKDLQVGVTPETSRTGTPTPAASSASSTAKSAAVKAIKQEKKVLNTENVTVEATFVAPADELFQMLTEESKIPMWTRAVAQVYYFIF